MSQDKSSSRGVGFTIPLSEEEKRRIEALVGSWRALPGDQRRHGEQAEACERACDPLFKSKAMDQPGHARFKLLVAICTDEDILLTLSILVAACVYAYRWG